MGVCALVHSTIKKLCSDICLINLLFLKVIRYLSSGTCLKVKRKNHPSMGEGRIGPYCLMGIESLFCKIKRVLWIGGDGSTTM